MAGFKVNGTDLDNILLPYEGYTESAPNTNYKTSSNDLRNQFESVDNINTFAGGPIDYKVDGTQLNFVLAQRYDLFSINGPHDVDGSSAVWNTEISSEISATFTSSNNRQRFADYGGEIRLQVILSGSGLTTAAQEVAVLLSSISIIGVGKNYVNTYPMQSPGEYFHFVAISHDGTKGLANLTSSYSTLFTATSGNTTVTLEGKLVSTAFYFNFKITRTNAFTVNGDLELYVAARHNTFNVSGLNLVPVFNQTVGFNEHNIILSSLSNNNVQMDLSKNGQYLAFIKGSSGSVYVYNKSGNTFTEQYVDSLPDGNWKSISIDHLGEHLVVSSSGLNGSYDARVRIYSRSGSTWSLQQTITRTPGDGSRPFGENVSISEDGSWLAVTGRTSASFNGFTIYNRSGTTWSFHSQGTNMTDNLFGRGISINSDGTILAVSYIGLNTVYILTRSGTTWTLQETLSNGSRFGYFVKLSGSGQRLLIGRHDTTNYSLTDTFVYSYSISGWEETFSYRSSSGTVGSNTGLGISGDIINSGKIILRTDTNVVETWDSDDAIRSRTIVPSLATANFGTRCGIAEDAKTMYCTGIISGTPGANDHVRVSF